MYNELLHSCCFHILSLPLKVDYNVSWCGSLWIHLPWNLLSFFDVYINIFHQVWKVFSYYYFKYSLCPFFPSSGTPTIHMLIYLIVSHRSLKFCSLFFNLFSFCSSNSIIFIVLSPNLLILSYACWNMPLKPSSKFSILIIVHFNFRISVCFSLGFLFLHWYFHFAPFPFCHFLDLLHIFL